MLFLLEAMKASKSQKSAEVASPTDIPSDSEGPLNSQASSEQQQESKEKSEDILDQLKNPLGIFSEKDLQVLYEYCMRTKGAALPAQIEKRQCSLFLHAFSWLWKTLLAYGPSCLLLKLYATLLFYTLSQVA